MYENVKRNTLQAVCFALLIFLLYIFTYTDIVSLRIGNAILMPLIAPIIVIGMNYGEWAGFWSGLVVGIFCDAVGAKVSCFNTLFLLIIGCAAGVLIKYYLNRNILTSLVLSLAASILYFSVYFLLHYFTGEAQGFKYLLFYALPSAIYTAIFMLPVFYFGQLVKKI